MWWNAHAVPLTRAWWNAPYYWPLTDTLALTEHLAGLSPITTPIQWLGGSPLLAYNLVLIASTWWSGLATHALVRRLTGCVPAAYCAGLAFAFAPYRTSQLAHMQLYACWWLPLVLLSLHAYYEEGRARWLVLAGVGWLLQGLTNGYFLLFLPILVGLWMAWFTRRGRDSARDPRRRGARARDRVRPALPAPLPRGANGAGPLPQRRRDARLQRLSRGVSERHAADAVLAHGGAADHRAVSLSRRDGGGAGPRRPGRGAARSPVPVLRRRGGRDGGAQLRARGGRAHARAPLASVLLAGVAPGLQRPARADADVHAGDPVPGRRRRDRALASLAAHTAARRGGRARRRGPGRRRRDRGHAARVSAGRSRARGAQRPRAGAPL